MSCHILINQVCDVETVLFWAYLVSSGGGSGTLLCLSVPVLKAYSSRFVYLCIYVSVCMYVTPDFSKVAKNIVLANAAQAQCDNILNYIVLDFWLKTQFTIYGVICPPWTLLWHILDSLEDKSACNRSSQLATCINTTATTATAVDSGIKQ